MAVSVSLISQLVEKIAPKSWAEEWDNVGLLVGSSASTVERILLTVDGTIDVVEEAKAKGAQLILAHHPIMFKPLKNLRYDNASAQLPLRLIEYGIGYYAAHTNLDQSSLSSSRVFAEALGLEDMQILAPVGRESLLKLVVFVPRESAETVRGALAAAGVGKGVTDGPHSEFYAESFFESQGEGIFRPLSGSDPAVGEIGKLARVEETRLESILPEHLLSKAIKALHKSHPYEEPAYDVIPLRNSGKVRGYGIIGRLSKGIVLDELWEKLLKVLIQAPWDEHKQAKQIEDPAGIRLAGDKEKVIRKIAIVNGSGGSFVQKALFQGADLLITGDVSHHELLDALDGGMAVCDIGHFLSELPMLTTLKKFLENQKELKDIDIIISSENKVPWRI